MARRKVVYRTRMYPFTGAYDVLQAYEKWEVVEFRVMHMNGLMYEIYLLEHVETERYPRQDPDRSQ
jgi:hypothetical protein